MRISMNKLSAEQMNTLTNEVSKTHKIEGVLHHAKTEELILDGGLSLFAVEVDGCLKMYLMDMCMDILNEVEEGLDILGKDKEGLTKALDKIFKGHE